MSDVSCLDCEGMGENPCEDCGGDQSPDNDCDTCNGTGNCFCHTCDGSGSVPACVRCGERLDEDSQAAGKCLDCLTIENTPPWATEGDYK